MKINSILASVLIGVYHDLSWTNPILAILLRTLSPLSSTLTACFIYLVGSRLTNTYSDSGLAYILVGAILYTHIASYAWVPTVAIGEGKNLFVFQYITITPSSATNYLVGRSLSSFAISLITSALAFVSAYFLLSYFVYHLIIIKASYFSLPLTFLVLLVNFPASLGLGFYLAAYALYASKFEWALPSYVAGLLMVFSGALFPPNVLPIPLSAIASYLPFTQLIQAVRDVVIYSDYNSFIINIALGSVGALVLLGSGYFLFKFSETRARKIGALDRRLA